MAPWSSAAERAFPVYEEDEFALYGAEVPAPRDAIPASARLAMARWLLALKDRRPFPEFRGDVGEPAWEILLDLYIGELIGRSTSITSACIASRAPPTTALRYVTALYEARRIERHPDESDGRRCWLRLAPGVTEAIDAYIAGLIDEFREMARAIPEISDIA